MVITHCTVLLSDTVKQNVITRLFMFYYRTLCQANHELTLSCILLSDTLSSIIVITHYFMIYYLTLFQKECDCTSFFHDSFFIVPTFSNWDTYPGTGINFVTQFSVPIITLLL